MIHCPECRKVMEHQLTRTRIHNSELERKIAGYRAALKGIADIEPGSRGAYSKFVEAQIRARDALGSTDSGEVKP